MIMEQTPRAKARFLSFEEIISISHEDIEVSFQATSAKSWKTWKSWDVGISGSIFFWFTWVFSWAWVTWVQFSRLQLLDAILQILLEGIEFQEIFASPDRWILMKWQNARVSVSYNTRESSWLLPDLRRSTFRQKHECCQDWVLSRRRYSQSVFTASPSAVICRADAKNSDILTRQLIDLEAVLFSSKSATHQTGICAALLRTQMRLNTNPTALAEQVVSSSVSGQVPLMLIASIFKPAQPM